ncbi:unnamed protein product [Adineta ricciae]|uniref:Cytochrome P450 n=1 Tax=Adineta ricciae TaxID=249248 RepID=A0A814IZ43_ADIRI|nr:unnamed protein product [Adineta ricciae]
MDVTWILLIIVLYLLAVVTFHMYVRYLSAQRHNFDPRYLPVIVEPWYCPFLGPALALMDLESAVNRWRARFGENFTVFILGKFVTVLTKYSDLKTYYHAPEETLSLGQAALVLLGSAFPESHFIKDHNSVPHIQRILTPRFLRQMAINIDQVIDDYFNLKNGQFWEEYGNDAVVDIFDFAYRFVLRTNSASFASHRIYKNHVTELIDLFTTLDADKSFINPFTHGIKTRLGIRSERDVAWEKWVNLFVPEIEHYVKMIEDNIQPKGTDFMYETIKYAIEDMQQHGETLTPRYIGFLIYGIFFPAQLNTYTTLAYVLLEWIRHEHDEIGDKLQEEINSAPPPGELTIDYLNSLEYIQACIYEVIRTHTEFPIAFRYATADVQLADGKFVPTGNLVISPLTRAHELYVDPYRFDPDRHLKPREEMKADPYKALPFGRGKHPCSGEKYVKMQIRIVLIRLAKLCTMEIMPESIDYEKIVNKKQLVGLSRPTKPVYVRITKRC